MSGLVVVFVKKAGAALDLASGSSVNATETVITLSSEAGAMLLTPLSRHRTSSSYLKLYFRSLRYVRIKDVPANTKIHPFLLLTYTDEAVTIFRST